MQVSQVANVSRVHGISRKLYGPPVNPVLPCEVPLGSGFILD